MKVNFLKNNVTGLIIGIIILLFIIAIFSSIIKKPAKDLTFAEGFSEIKALDEKHNTDFHREIVGLAYERVPSAKMITFKNISPYLEDLRNFYEALGEAKNTTERDALLLLTQARSNMLLAQKHYQLAQSYQPSGWVTDEDGFACSEAEDIRTTATHLIYAWRLALEAQSQLDDVLYINRKHEDVHNLVGIDENKTDFYYSLLDYPKQQADLNIQALTQYCNIDIAAQQLTLE